MHTDVAIVGGGPAGLQAALSLSRIHRRAVLLDDGTYRNATVSHMHNVLTNDGTPPADYRAAAHRELAAYDTLTVLRTRADDIEQTGDTFRLRLADGSELTAAALVLATGVRDELPRHRRPRRALGRPRGPVPLLPRPRVRRLPHRDRRRRARRAPDGHARPDRLRGRRARQR